MNLTIRTATKKDQDGLIAVLEEIHGPELKELAEKYVNATFSADMRKPTFILAIDKDEIIGTAAYTEELFTTDTWGIGWVGVKEPYRNRGIGQKIIESCLNCIKQQTSQTVTVILRTHPDKNGLYTKLNFSKLGLDHEGGLFMTKTLEHQTL
jgi:N-acetylglutamate synthase-like GNAT family acetyltransferase